MLPVSRRACLVALLASGAALHAGLAGAERTTTLDRYLDGLDTLRAEFTQRVVDARGQVVQDVSGTLTVQRPGRFRWEIRPGDDGFSEGQVLVADGENLWFYDRDLEQVTVKPAAEALTATPAMLLTGAVELRSAFRIDEAGKRDGLDWVRVVPIRADADFRDAAFGFKGGELRRLVLNDKLGQTATLVFENAARNARVAATDFEFTPPPGADVIGTAAG